MAKVEAFAIPGIRLWFYSHDHRPPHFHALREGEWELRVFFLEADTEMIEIVWNSRSRAPIREIKKLCAEARLHRRALLDEWHIKVNPE